VAALTKHETHQRDLLAQAELQYGQNPQLKTIAQEIIVDQMPPARCEEASGYDRTAARLGPFQSHQDDEIAVDIAGRLNLHVFHHLDHRGIVLFQERGLVADSRRLWLRG
jgi:hypothetical protein